MLRKSLIFLALAAIACHAAPSSELIDRLYEHVIVGDYDSAVADTKSLESSGKGHLISQVIKKLIDEGQRNVVVYAYKVYQVKPDIVKKRFPLQFRMILESSTVKLIYKRDNLAMKLSKAVDSEGDRTAYGDKDDKSSDRVSWKLIPFLEDDKVYFKIMAVKVGQYLKLGTDADSDGDHQVYGSSGADSFRHQWYLVPANYKGELLFYIFNREYNQALKLGRAVDDIGDRQVYSENGDVIGKPDLFGWSIKPF